MDKKDLVITFLGLFIFILLAAGGYYVYFSIERELTNTKSDLNDTNIQLNNTKNELARTKNELVDTKNDLAGTKYVLSNTKLELSRSQDETRELNVHFTEVQKNADDLKFQLEDAQNSLDRSRESNFHLASQIRMLQNQIMALRVGLVKQGYSDLPNSNHLVLSPVYFDTSKIKPQRVKGIAYGPSDKPLDGVLMNNPTWVAGIKDRALKFNGSNQYVLLGNILQESYTNLSVACWVKHASTSWQNIVERGEWDTSDGIGLMMDYSGQSVDFGHYNNFVRSKAFVQDDQWHFVVGTMAPDGDNFVFSIYVDGKLDNTYTSPVGLDTTTKPWTIGGRYNGSWLYRGLIEDVRFYNRTLSAAEVNKLYNQ